MAEHTLQITDQTFQELVANERPTLVDFWADWCGPCNKIAPILDELAAEHADKLTVATLNVDENPHSAMEFNVMSIPTLILFIDGVEKRRLTGALPKHALEAELAEYIS
jgi:thioredoxin 1